MIVAKWVKLNGVKFDVCGKYARLMEVKVSRVLVGIILVFATLSAWAKDVATIYQESKDSIVLIVSYDSNMTPLRMGSGFYFRSGLIATNFHVIDGTNSFLIRNIGDGQEFRDATVKSYSERLDIAILSTATKGNALPIAASTSEIGDQVMTIGNPRGLEGSVSVGIVSGVRKAGELTFYQITAPISPGSSGGPVFNTDGSVIGIATFTLQDSQNLNFAMPASLLTTLETKSMAWEPPGAPKVTRVKRENAGIEMSYFSKGGSEFWETVSLRNTNNYAVENIVGILIYKKKGVPIDFQLFRSSELIPPGLAKMIRQRSFDQDQNWAYVEDQSLNYGKERFSVEMRIFNYDIVESEQSDILDAILN